MGDSGPFALNEKVLVPHTDKFYEAKVLKAQKREDGLWYYLLHYTGALLLSLYVLQAGTAERYMTVMCFPLVRGGHVHLLPENRMCMYGQQYARPAHAAFVCSLSCCVC
jgi:hypothetical protein